MRILAITRAKQFSPNSVEKDLDIIMSVVSRLRGMGHEVESCAEEDLPLADSEAAEDDYDAIMTMGRKPETLAWLKNKHCLVVNSPKAVECSARSVLLRLMKENDIPVPPDEGCCGYWLKRGDACAQSPDDVVFCKDKAELEAQKKVFAQRGIDQYVVSAHVMGDLVKFYGVRGSRFFRYFYPTDDGQSKYGDEQRNGVAHHYCFDEKGLAKDVERLALATDMDVYGGDCIVRPDGTYCIIDFNDWPSFSRCRDDAAQAIAGMVELRVKS